MRFLLISGVFLLAAPLRALHPPEIRQAAVAQWQASVNPPPGQKPIKCGTWMHQVLRADFQALPPAIQDAYRQSPLGKKSAAASQGTFSLLGGIFVIEFDTAGVDAVPDSDAQSWSETSGFGPGGNGIPDYVEFVAAAADSCYRLQVQQMGYLLISPRVVFRMMDLGQTYGYAIDAGSLEIDNDMGFFDPDSVDIRTKYDVTIAHELFHAVQFGYTDVINFFHEASAVWMEDRAYPQADDYLQYMDYKTPVSSGPTIFSHPEIALDDVNHENYDRAVWPKFLDERYSDRIIRYAWEQYGSYVTTATTHNATVQIFDVALKRFDSTLAFAQVFGEFGRWMFYTGTRSPFFPTFQDASLWPEVRMDSLDFPSVLAAETLGLAPLSLRYRRLLNRVGKGIGFELEGGPDTIAACAARREGSAVWKDSLFFTGSGFSNLSGWEGKTFSEEYLHFFNSRPSGRTLRYLVLDSLFLFSRGQNVSGILSPGLSFRLVFEEDFSVLLKDSAGNLRPEGYALLNLFGKSGLSAVEQVPPSLPGVSNLISVHQIDVAAGLDSLVARGTVSLVFEMADSSGSAVNFSVYARPTGAGPAVAALPGGGLYTLNYGDFREGLSAADTLRRFYLYSVGLQTLFQASVFPSPAYRGDPSVHLVYAGPDNAVSHCRLYGLSGHLIKTLKSGEKGEHVRGLPVAEGEYQQLFRWDLKTEGGLRVAPGIYLYYVDRKGRPPLRGKIAVVGASRPAR